MAPQGPGKKLLVVGASATLSRAVRSLNAAGLNSYDHTEDLDMVLSRGYEYRAIVMTGSLGSMTLPDVLNVVHSRLPQSPTVVLTGSDADQDRLSKLMIRLTPHVSQRREDKVEIDEDLKLSNVKAVLVASSTGGPDALARFLSGLDGALPVPMLIAQHILVGFTESLCEQLRRSSGLDVQEALHGRSPQPGQVFIAPGGQHLRVVAGGKMALDVGPEVNGCRPSADILFDSAVTVHGGKLLGVVLTGMGSDGLNGSRALVKAGGTVLAQDEQSSTVWGMPGAVTKAGLAAKNANPRQLGVLVRGMVGSG